MPGSANADGRADARTPVPWTNDSPESDRPVGHGTSVTAVRAAGAAPDTLIGPVLLGRCEASGAAHVGVRMGGPGRGGTAGRGGGRRVGAGEGRTGPVDPPATLRDLRNLAGNGCVTGRVGRWRCGWNAVDAGGRKTAYAPAPQGPPIAAMIRVMGDRQASPTTASPTTSSHETTLLDYRLAVAYQVDYRLIVPRLRSIMWE